MSLPLAHPPLARILGPAAVLFLTLSAITPASSVFVILPGMFAAAGTGALWAMLIAAAIGVATAFVYAELSSAWPIAGGEYVMVARTLGPLPGFVILGVNAVNNLIFVAVVSLGLAEMAARFVPGLPAIPVAMATVLVATGFALLDIRVGALVTGLFLAVEVAALGVVAWLGLDPVRPVVAMLAAPLAPAGDGLAPASLTQIGLAAAIGVFALNGYGMAVYFGEEMRDAARRVGRVVLAALAGTLALELAPMAALLGRAGDLPAILAAPDPFGGFVAEQAGDRVAGWVAAAIAIAILNAGIVSILAFARFFYATGRDGVWGGRIDPWLTALHPRLGSPVGATLVTGGIGLAACLMPLDLLLVMSGTGLIVTYAALALAAVTGRRRGRTAHAAWRMPLYPLAPALTVVAAAALLWVNWLDAATGRPSILATAAQMAAAALYYALVLRRRGDWLTRDPFPAAVPAPHTP